MTLESYEDTLGRTIEFQGGIINIVMAERDEARRIARRLYAKNAELVRELDAIGERYSMWAGVAADQAREIAHLRAEVERLKQQRNRALRNWGLLIGTKNLLDDESLSQEEKNILLEMRNEY